MRRFAGRCSAPFGLLFTVLWLSGCAAAGTGGELDTDRDPASATDAATPRGDAGGTTNEDVPEPPPPPNPEAFWADDPPPMQCLEDGSMGPLPEPPGGTPECPDDKNREGCPCDTEGEEAACWPGLRANRGYGICQDGRTRCEFIDEFNKVWGPCEDYVLPREGATTAREACTCFSAGRWDLQNVSPCFGPDFAVSTVWQGAGPACPQINNPPTAPNQSWSENSLTVDCGGKFELCFTLKAGDASNPSAADCTLAEVCTEAWYQTPGEAQPFPALPGWVSHDSACVNQFKDSGGYGEMSVKGLSVACDNIDDGSGGRYVFNRVPYCSLECNENPSAPGCENCQSGGSGNF